MQVCLSVQQLSMSKAKLQQKVAKQYLTLQPTNEPQQKLGFTFNPFLIGIAAAVFALLYFTSEHHRVKFFVYCSIAINLCYPFLITALRRDVSLKRRLLEGTFLPSLMIDIWTLWYPQKVFVYYLPQAIGMIAKVTDLVVTSNWRADVTSQLCKFQSKIELLVLAFCFISSIIKLKLIWPRILKWVILLTIFRFKYWKHYGCQVACSEIHFSLDHLSKTLLVRHQYQQLYSKVCMLGNRFNSNQEVLL